MTKKLGCEAIIVIPENALPKKIEGAKKYGAKVILHGTTYQEAMEKVEEIASECELVRLSPF